MLARNMMPQYETDELNMQKRDEALDLFFKTQAILTDSTSLAKFGAMIANNGNNCSSGENCLK